MIPTLPPLRPRPSDNGTLLSARAPLPRRDRRAAKLVPLAPLASPRKPAPPSSPRPPLWRTLLLVLAILLAEFFLVRRCAAPSPSDASPPDAPSARADSPDTSDATPSDPEPPPPPPPLVWASLTAPTPQTALDTPDFPGVLQPTGSGRLESAKFGSTRTGATGKPRFHEGVDIAATTRDRRGRPADPIFAVADGRVAFVNRSPGASSYGMYIVLEHPDPSLGVRTNASGCVTSVVYTLYAHLSDIAFGVRPGATVEAGEKIATMGTTSNTRPPIPNERGHLHWEVGLLLNSRYDRQSRELKNGNMFGLYNGQNLFGLDPLRVWKTFQANPDLSMRDYLFAHPVACTVLLRGRFPDFFTRNPGLWDGPPPDGTPIRIDLSESGCPLRGRNATDSELVVLGNARHAVLKADPAVLGRNARAYIRKKPSGAWEFTDTGRAWATALFYN